MNARKRRLIMAVGLSVLALAGVGVAIYKTGNLLYLTLLFLPPLQLWYVRRGAPKTDEEAQREARRLMLVPVAVYAAALVPLVLVLMAFASLNGD